MPRFQIETVPQNPREHDREPRLKGLKDAIKYFFSEKPEKLNPPESVTGTRG